MAVLLVGVVALLVYALTDAPVTVRAAHRTVTSEGVLRSVSGVPASVFDTVGVSSADAALVPPTVVSGQPVLSSGGKPEVLSVGAEYCPFCGAERWPLVVALARFGTFHLLHDMRSSATSVFPGIQTFTFVNASYTSRYLTFVGIELYSDVAGTTGTFTRIAVLTPAQQALVSRYGSPGASTGSSRTPAGALPFVDIGNRLVASTAGFSPAAIEGLSQASIVADLVRPTQPDGRAIVASANYLTAGICAVTHQQPAAVCAGKGAQAADAALGLG